MSEDVCAAPEFKPIFKAEKATIQIDVSVANFEVGYSAVEAAVIKHVRNLMDGEQLVRLTKISLEPIIDDDTRFQGYDVIVTLRGTK